MIASKFPSCFRDQIHGGSDLKQVGHLPIRFAVRGLVIGHDAIPSKQ